MVRRVLRAEEVNIGDGGLGQNAELNGRTGCNKTANVVHRDETNAGNSLYPNRNRRIISGREPPAELFNQKDKRNDKAATENNRQSNQGIRVVERSNRCNHQNTKNKYRNFTLFPHQIEAVEWTLKSGLNSRLIGDEMRVGKTPTAIEIDLELRKKIGRKQRGNNCSLIVCPKSVLSVWSNHLVLMGVDPRTITTIDFPSKKEIKKVLGLVGRDKRKTEALARYIIINWDAVQTIRSELQRAGPWFHVIGDEIHRIKGRDTKRTNSFKRIPTKQKTGLSGTPADNRPEDFWSVLNWLRPKEYGSYWNFVDRYCEVEYTRTGFKKIVGINRDTVPELREKIRPFYIRRTLKQVASNIPQKQYRTITVEMGKRQRAEYNRFDKQDIVSVLGGDILADYDIVKLVRLQQMAIGCCSVISDEVHITDNPRSPKLDAAIGLIEDDSDSGPFIVFAQHHDTVRLLSKRLADKAIPTRTLIGTDDPESRKQAVADFQSGKADVFVGTIGACREGITLSRANTIIFIDRAWNPNWNKQAEARADSLTGDKPVTIIYLMTKDSIDEARQLRIDQKGRDTNAITAPVIKKRKLPGKVKSD